MKIRLAENAKNHTTDAINLALSRAQNLSKRAGVGWALMDSHDEILKCDAVIAGLDKSKLIRAIREYQHTLDHLFISIEPVGGAFEVAELINIINASQCSHVTIGHRHSDEYADKTWRSWEDTWSGEIDYLSVNTVAEHLGYGITNIRKYQRPWVIAVSAANFTGLSLPLQNFVNEFGFLHYLSNLVQQNRALLYSPSQRNFLASIPDTNSMEEPLELFEIFDEDNIHSILHYCAREERCSVVVLCDMPMLGYLINKNLVDEIVHHISNIGEPVNGGLALHENHPQVGTMTQTFFNLNDWKLLSSSVAGNCSRVVLRKQLPATESTLRRGLN